MQILNAFLEQRDRWILWAPVAMAVGIGGYFSLTVEPPLWLGAVLVALLLAGIAPFYKNKAAVLLWLPFFLVALGFAAAQVRTALVDAPMLSYKSYPLIMEARVAHVDALPKGASRVVLDQITYDPGKGLPQERMPERVRIKLKSGQAPMTGDVIRVRAVLLPLSPPVLPGAYDFQRHAFYSQIGATGYAIGDAEVVKAKGEGFFFPSLRRYLREHIKAAMTNPDAAAITIALLDGEDQDISKETLDVIRAAGIAHLIAISGLQVTLVTGFFFFVVRALLASIPYVALRYPIKKITAFIAMCGAIFYMMLIGESVSAERSVLMVCIIMIALMLDRDPFTLRVAAFAAAVMLLVQPEILFGASFQMSFAAVVALVAFYESTREWWKHGYEDRSWYGKIGIYLAGSLATTLIASLATSAFALFHFLKTPLFPGLVENLIAVPVSSFVTMPSAIIGSFMMPLGFEKIPLMIAEWSVILIIKTAAIVSTWPYALYHTDAWPMWILVMMCFGGLWLCIWQKRMRWLGLVPVFAGLALIQAVPRADVLVSQSGKIFAVRDDAGVLWLSSKQAEKFVRTSWIEREGGRGYGFWDEAGSPVSCDEEACLFQRKGRTISFVKKHEALQRDCVEGNIVISELYLARDLCSGADGLVGKYNLRQKGAHAFYFGDAGYYVRTVHAERGLRAWNVRYPKKPL